MRLKDRDYLVGDGRGEFSNADIKAFPWVLMSPWAGVFAKDKPKAYKPGKTASSPDQLCRRHCTHPSTMTSSTNA